MKRDGLVGRTEGMVRGADLGMWEVGSRGEVCARRLSWILIRARGHWFHWRRSVEEEEEGDCWRDCERCACYREGWRETTRYFT